MSKKITSVTLVIFYEGTRAVIKAGNYRTTNHKSLISSIFAFRLRNNERRKDSRYGTEEFSESSLERRNMQIFD